MDALARGGGDPTRSVFLDESGVRTDLLSHHDRGRLGVRVRDALPDGWWHTTTLLAGLHVDGLVAPGVFDGPIDGPSLEAYIEQVLVLTLQPGDIVVMDNLSCHRGPTVQRATEAAGAQRWFLPTYSPAFKPIALSFAKLKAILRAARCRSLDAIWHTIGLCLWRFTAAECHSYFRHCGYSAADVRS